MGTCWKRRHCHSCASKGEPGHEPGCVPPPSCMLPVVVSHAPTDLLHQRLPVLFFLSMCCVLRAASCESARSQAARFQYVARGGLHALAQPLQYPGINTKDFSDGSMIIIIHVYRVTQDLLVTAHHGRQSHSHQRFAFAVCRACACAFSCLFSCGLLLRQGTA